MTKRLFDSHAHLEGPRFKDDLSDTLKRAHALGITDIVCIGASDGFESNPLAVGLAESEALPNTPKLWASVGIHPHDAHLVDAACVERLGRLADRPRVVAIGETGLDYYYKNCPADVQGAAFRASIGLARTLRRPLVVHSREAEEDTLAILRAEHAQAIGGVIHCFTGTEVLAQGALDLGFYISLSGVITFRNTEKLQAIVQGLPQDRVLVETDCPYLAPVPYRGQRNEPAFMLKTVEILAGLWNVSLDHVKSITGANAARLFGV